MVAASDTDRSVNAHHDLEQRPCRRRRHESQALQKDGIRQSQPRPPPPPHSLWHIRKTRTVITSWFLCQTRIS